MAIQGDEENYQTGDQEAHEYRNKTVINQRGATVEINNSTDREELKLSQYSGSNIALTNVVNSELATNNKQIKVNNDSFESVGSDKNVYVGKDKVERVSENTYILRGFKDGDQLRNFTEWKNAFKNIADNNSQFRMLRGGFSFPNGVETDQSPADVAVPEYWKNGRAKNPTLNPVDGNKKPVVNNGQVEVIVPTIEEVADGSGGQAGGLIGPVVGFDTDEWTSNNPYGSQSPGVIQFGSEWSAATEGGRWLVNPLFAQLDPPDDDDAEESAPVGEKVNQQQLNIIGIQGTLNDYEMGMGNGGDEIAFVKRHKIETIGAAVNEYPSIRIDPQGRSQPIGIDVGENTSYENMGSIPHVEGVDNDMAFPAGNYTLNVGNRYNVLVGAGGVQLKTSGAMEIGATATKIAGSQVTIQASTADADYAKEGSGSVHIASDNAVAIQGQKSVSLKSNRQVLVSPSLGVKHNLKVGGGAYVEGELYVHHITAPVVQESTSNSGTQLGKFNTFCDRQLKVAEARLDIRKLKEQLDWVERDDAAREAAAAPENPVQDAADLLAAQEAAAQQRFEQAQNNPLDPHHLDPLVDWNPDWHDFWLGIAADDEFIQQQNDFNAGVEGAVNPAEGWNPGNDPNKWNEWDPRGPAEDEEETKKEDYICWYPVYALKDDNLIKMPGHSHQHSSLPIRRMATNADVRKQAMCEYINRDDRISHARVGTNDRPFSSGGIRGGCTTTQQPKSTPPPETTPKCPKIEDCSCETTDAPTTQPPTTPTTTPDPITYNPGQPGFLEVADLRAHPAGGEGEEVEEEQQQAPTSPTPGEVEEEQEEVQAELQPVDPSTADIESIQAGLDAVARGELTPEQLQGLWDRWNSRRINAGHPPLIFPPITSGLPAWLQGNLKQGEGGNLPVGNENAGGFVDMGGDNVFAGGRFVN